MKTFPRFLTWLGALVLSLPLLGAEPGTDDPQEIPPPPDTPAEGAAEDAPGAEAPLPDAPPAVVPNAGPPTPPPGVRTSRPPGAVPMPGRPASGVVPTATNLAPRLPARPVPVPSPSTTRPVVPGPRLANPPAPGAVPAPGLNAGADTGLPALPGGAALADTFAPSSTNFPGLGPDGKIAPEVVQLQMAPLEQVLSLYAEITRRTVLRATALPKVDIMLKNQTPWTVQEAVEALDSVLALNGIAMVNVGEKFVTAVPANTVLTEGAAFLKGDVKELSETGQFVTKVMKLKHVVPSEVQQIIQGFAKTPNGILAIDSTQTLVLRDYPANVKRMTEVIEQIDVEVENDYQLEVIPIKYGKVDEIYGAMGSLIGGGGGGGVSAAAGGAVARTTGVQRSSSRNMRGSSSRTGGYGGMGGYGGYGGSSYGGYRSGGYYPQDAATTPLAEELRHELELAGAYVPQQVAVQPVTPAIPRPTTTPGTATTSFNQRFQQILNRAGQQGGQVQLLQDARIVPDERSNSLIVFANKQDMKMITNIVAKVDRLLAQVVIDAIIMDVQLSDAYQLGVSWLMQPQKTGDWTQAAASNNGGNLVSGLTNIAGGFTYLARYQDDLNVAVQALASNSRGQILSRPRIQTSHAMSASFQVGESVPYVSGTYQGTVGYGPSSYFSQLDVSTSLDVTPFVTPDGLVVMDIDQNIEEISGYEEFPGTGRQPRTVYRSASATVSVRDRETIILGGYIRSNKSKTSSGVPLLKDIPLLGAAFRSKGSDFKRSELIVLIRPTVLNTPEEAAAEAEAERNRLPGMRTMDEDLEYGVENTGDKLRTLFGK